MATVRCRAMAVAVVIAMCIVSVSGQAPPIEMNGHHLMNVGPVAIPGACPCITNPFTLPAVRAGDGEARGPAGSQPIPAPSKEERHRTASQDAEDRSRLPRTVERGLDGDPNASMHVAWLLMSGTAVQRNEEQIASWLHLAARGGHPDAALQLGHRYHRGLGVTQNDQAAAYWFHAGAAAGDRTAMIALGLLHAAGRGLEQNWSAAVTWFEQANAPEVHPVASRFLGDAYACGLGVRQDHQRAAAAYQASARTDVTSRVQLGHMYLNGCAPGGDKAAFDAYESAAHDGDSEGQIALSDLLRQGRGVAQDSYNGYFWARLAELRTEPGPLRERASASAAAAARMLPEFLIKDADTMAQSIIADARK